METFRKQERDAFTNAYLNCALWLTSVSDENGEILIESVADEYDISHIDPACHTEMVNDCAAFMDSYSDELRTLDLLAADCGQLFWLTRERHGSGFWEYGTNATIRSAAEELTAGAHAYGDFYIVGAWEG